jgi:hypothetical protein
MRCSGKENWSFSDVFISFSWASLIIQCISHVPWTFIYEAVFPEIGEKFLDGVFQFEWENEGVQGEKDGFRVGRWGRA